MVASKSVKKHKTNTDDNHGTITIYCCSLASGVDGPLFYLVKVEMIDIQTFKAINDSLEDMDCQNSWHSDWEGIK